MKHDRGGECGAKVSSWSSVTPRSRTTGEKIKWGKSAAMADRSSFASCCRVPNQLNWVFDGLSLKRLVDIQVSKTSKVLLIAKTVAAGAYLAFHGPWCKGPTWAPVFTFKAFSHVFLQYPISSFLIRQAFADDEALFLTV